MVLSANVRNPGVSFASLSPTPTTLEETVLSFWWGLFRRCERLMSSSVSFEKLQVPGDPMSSWKMSGHR